MQLPAYVEAKAQGRQPKLSSSSLRKMEAPDSLFESDNHCMHGVLHANGFGHLMRMNACDGNGIVDKLTGGQLMSIWDSLCELLAVRAYPQLE